MEQFELERGIRDSETRYVDQHAYYRQCQIKKKDLEQNLLGLSTEKTARHRDPIFGETEKRA